MSDGQVIIDTKLDTKNADKQAKSLGNTLSNGIGKAGKVAKAGLMAVGTTAVATGGALVKMAKDTADTGDHIDKMSQKLGISAEAYQKWDYVAKISGTSIDGLKMGFKTLTNTIDKANQGDKTAIENFNRIGMSIDDLKGKTKEDIFQQTVKSLQNVSDETERSAMANKLLGRAGMELGPLLNSSNKDIDQLMKTAEEYGMVMSDKAVKASAQFQDSLTTMGQTFTGLKNRMMAEFLPAMTEVTDGLALVFKGDTDEGIEKINSGITGFIDKLSEIMPKVLEVGGNIIMTLATAILNNAPQLLEAGTNIILQLLQGLLNALPNIITGIVGAIPQILNALTSQLPTIINTLIQGLMTALTGIYQILPQIIQAGINLFLALVQGILEAIPTFVEMLPELIQSMIDYVLEALPMIINGIIQLVNMIVQQLPTILMAIVNALPQIITMLVNALITGLPMLINGIIRLVIMLVENLPKIIIALVRAIPKIIVSVVNALIKALPQLIKGVIQLVIMLVKNLPKIIMDLIKAIPTIIVEVVKALIEAVPELIKGVFQMIVMLVKSLPKLLVTLWNFIKTIPSKIWNLLKGLIGFATKLGGDMIKGLWNGIKNLGKWIWDKIKGFFGGIVGGIKKFFGIKSPSKLMRDQVGKFIAQGIWVGFDENNPMDDINNSLAKGMATLDTSFKMDMSRGIIDYNALANAINASIDLNNNIQGLAGAVVEGIENSNLTVKIGEREMGRVVRSY